MITDTGVQPLATGVLMLSSARLQTIICTSRIQEAERFYSEVLGLSLKGRAMGALVYDVQGSALRVSQVTSTNPSEHTVMGFAVSDLRTVMAALGQRGVVWEHFPNFPQDAEGVLHAPDGSQVAWFRDPDRNLLSIVQYPEDQTWSPKFDKKRGKSR